MSSTVSAAWSRLVLSLCCIEPGPSRGAIMSDRIITVAMSRSGQLGLRCTVKSNCSGMSARLAGASVTHDHTLDTCEPSCVPRAARPFFIHVVHNPLGVVGYVAAPELSSQGGEAGPHGSAGDYLGREARSEAEEHVAALELSSQGVRDRSHETRGSARVHLDREARSGVEERMTVSELNSSGRRGPGPRVTWQHRSSPQQGGEVRGHGTRGVSGAHLYREVWSEAAACVTVCGCTHCSLS
jgi:hypothetical protein